MCGKKIFFDVGFCCGKYNWIGGEERNRGKGKKKKGGVGYEECEVFGVRGIEDKLEGGIGEGLREVIGVYR